MIEKYHKKFTAMARRFIMTYPSLQGDDSMTDLLVNEIYVKALELPEAKQVQEGTVMQAAWYACMHMALWHMSCMMGRKKNKDGTPIKGAGKMPILTCGTEEIPELGEYDPVLDKQLEFGTFFQRLPDKSKYIMAQYLQGYTITELAERLGVKKTAIVDQLSTIRTTARLHSCGFVRTEDKTGWRCPSDQIVPLSLRGNTNISRINRYAVPEKEVLVSWQ